MMEGAKFRGPTPVALLKALLAASLLGPTLVLAVAGWQQYHALFAIAEQRAQHISNVLEEHALKSLETVALAMRATDARLTTLDWETIRTSRALWEEITTLQQSSDQVGSLFVIDPAGRNPLTTRVFPATDLNFSDRDYFYEQKRTDRGLYVGHRYEGKISARPIFNLSIRRSIPNGQFDGVIGSSVFVEYFENFYATAGMPEDRFAIALVRDGGEVLVRYPVPNGALARFPREQFEQSDGIFTARSPIDDVERLYGAKKLRGFPLTVLYGIDRGTVLAGWYRYMASWGGIAAAAATGLFLACRLALRRAQAERKALELWRNTAEELRQESERRTKAEASLVHAQKQEAIGQLTGGIAHDFNNLLAVILSNLTLIRKRVKSDDRTSQLVDSAIQGAERGVTLTRRLLAFARRQDLSPRAVELPGLMAGMSDLLQRSLGSEHQIIIDFPADLPAVRADRNQLELALLNLLINARDAMPLGGKIVVSAHKTDAAQLDGELAPGGYVCVGVKDAGTGMDEATLAKATEPFFTTKGVGKGTGLGLSMVHGFAAQSGGALCLSSRVGVGTTAEICLPSAEHESAHEPEEERPLPAVSSTRKVLVVEDDMLVGAGTVAMLEDLGHAAVHVSTGQRALDMLGEGKTFDIVITDQSMPGMTGLELAHRIRERWPGMRIILATGHADLPETRSVGLPLLFKPFDQGDLIRAFSAPAASDNSPVNAIRWQ
jgi:signal transduction histidine kinase/ActR/RegA family two-component response regulator